MSVAQAEVVLVAGDARDVLPQHSGLAVATFAHPSEAIAHLSDLRARRAPAIFVLGRADVNQHAVLMEVITRHPDVPVIVAADSGTGSLASHALTHPPRSRALLEAIADACRSAVQRSRVRTTIDRLNMRIAAGVADPRQQQRLVLSQLYLENILQQAHDAIFVTDRAGIVALWNPAAERLFALPGQDIVGQSIERAAPELLHAVQDLSAICPSRVADLPLSGRDSVREVELSLNLVSDAERTGIAVSGIARDVTERRALERTLKERADALAEANRHKDEFLAVLSHELRTPLNVVIGWAHMLEASPTDNEDLRRGLSMIRRNAELQQRLVDDLLDYARMVASRLTLQREMVDIADVVRSTVETLRPSIAEAELTLSEAYEPVPRTYADPSRLGQVIVNLVSNATKFTPPGGQISVRVSEQAGRVGITVADNGQGIPKEFLPHVFDEFKQANASQTRKQSGLGLGLAISRRIVELHQGTITAESAGRGQGATFCVVLPVREATLLPESAAG